MSDQPEGTDNTKDTAPEGEGLAAQLWRAGERVIDDAYDLGLRRMATEDALAVRLDTKAAGLLGVVGFAMTLAFTFGGWPLLDNVRKVPLGWLIALLFVGTLILGLVTAYKSLEALRIRKMKVVDESEVFASDLLLRKDRVAYRTAMAAHVWYVAQENFKLNESKATHIECGQTLFGYFLCGILALSAVAATGAIARAPDPAPPPMTCSCPSAPACPSLPQGMRVVPIVDATPAVPYAAPDVGAEAAAQDSADRHDESGTAP